MTTTFTRLHPTPTPPESSQSPPSFFRKALIRGSVCSIFSSALMPCNTSMWDWQGQCSPVLEMFNIPTIQYPWLACKKKHLGESIMVSCQHFGWTNWGKIHGPRRNWAPRFHLRPTSKTTWLVSVEIYPGNQGFCAMFSRQILSKTFLGDFGCVADFKVL